MQSTFTMEGDKFMHVQKWDGKETKFVRELKDGKMVMVRLNNASEVFACFVLTFVSLWRIVIYKLHFCGLIPTHS